MGGLLKHHEFNIKWIGFPSVKNRRVRGVYMFGNGEYVGASIHIRKRILSHIQMVKRGCTTNKTLYDYINDKLINNEEFEITFLSDDCFKESEMQSIYLKNKVKSKLERNYHQTYK